LKTSRTPSEEAIAEGERLGLWRREVERPGVLEAMANATEETGKLVKVCGI
jgi:hypothetical protein